MSELLAQFAGYYQIRPASGKTAGAVSFSSNAFVAIQGLYQMVDGIPIYFVTIGISSDGNTSKVYTFDGSMNFTDPGYTLTFNSTTSLDESFSLTFKRQYAQDGDFGSLVTLTAGTIKGTAIVGQTPLCPVPLTAFAGAPLTNTTGTETLVINSNTEITFNGEVLTEITYVPLMYILECKFSPTNGPANQTLVLSLGTDGPAGTACIVNTLLKVPGPVVISSVFAIPSQATKS